LAPEAAATRELYERHARKVYAFCLSRLRDHEEAEDATQSTFLNAFRGLQRGIEPEHESAWLYKIAENVCLTRQRSRSRRRRVEAPSDLDALQDTLPSPARDADALLHLPTALEGLPEQQRRALLLREWQGLSYREIADELDLSQSAVETLLFRARRSLVDGLEPARKKGLVARVRAGGDAGSVLALLKTLLFAGGAKVVVAGAVAATSVVAASSSGVRHSLEDTFVPHTKAVHPAVVAPSKPTVAAIVSPAVVQPAVAAVPAPVQHVVQRHRHAAVFAALPVVRHHEGGDGHRNVPVAPEGGDGHRNVPVAPAIVAQDPQPADQPAQPDQHQNGSSGQGHDGATQGDGHGRGSEQPTPPPSQQDQPASGSSQLPRGGGDSNGDGNHGDGGSSGAQPQQQSPSHDQQPQQEQQSSDQSAQSPVQQVTNTVDNAALSPQHDAGNAAGHGDN
jgi:RNA polymerase sigma factor (sigma-70 family)